MTLKRLIGSANISSVELYEHFLIACLCKDSTKDKMFVVSFDVLYLGPSCLTLIERFRKAFRVFALPFCVLMESARKTALGTCLMALKLNIG